MKTLIIPFLMLAAAVTAYAGCSDCGGCDAEKAQMVKQAKAECSMDAKACDAAEKAACDMTAKACDKAEKAACDMTEKACDKAEKKAVALPMSCCPSKG